jgi:DNA-binding NarL/FixJ family response regulator
MFSLWLATGSPVLAVEKLRLATMRSGTTGGTVTRVRPTVVIVDDHSDFRRSAGALLDAEGFQVIGEAADAAEAISAVTSLRPDIVLLDIQLPALDGFGVAELLCAQPDAPKVVLISSRDADTYRVHLRESLAAGFIRKSGLSGAALRELTR